VVAAAGPSDDLRQSIRSAVGYDRLSESEERSIVAEARAAGLGDTQIRDIFGEFGSLLAVARMNAGRLPMVLSPELALRAGEVAYVEVPATLVRESSRNAGRGLTGFKFKIARGTPYPAAGFRGRTLRSGGGVDDVDRGRLTITSQRAVFKGRQENVEAFYVNLLSLNTFDDGIQLHLSDRRNAPIFKVADGHLVAAALSTAVQRKL